jgi:hypothetical protein
VIGASGLKSSSSAAVTSTSGRCLSIWFGLVAQHLLEFGHRRLDQARVGDPAAVVAVGRVARLVARCARRHRDLVLLRIVLDRDQRRHAADRRRAALVAGLQQQQA